ncbi:MAG: altronate dehydratase family protein [Acholeplasmatales bacterium]|jgi:altronate hydrolase|nr:altronate dehydratase family protein [Acholeplasmatales bacterium]
MDAIIINQKFDNVAVALKDLKKGQVIEGILLLDDIAFGHKFAIKDIPEGQNIIKYGSPLGRAKKDILAGNWVHTFNVLTNLDKDINYDYQPLHQPLLAKTRAPKVKLYVRENGNYGIRNELWIIPSVGCINSLCRNYAQKFAKKHRFSQNYSAIKVLEHPYGCSQMGDDLANTTATLSALALNGNVGGVLIVGLGCENNKLEYMLKADYIPERTRSLNLQKSLAEETEFIQLLEELYENLIKDRRTLQPISCLTIGLKCGGSDGFSGITANPLIGKFSDWLVHAGGRVVLTEVPEMFGAEQLLMNRAKNAEVFQDFVKLINNFKEYYQSHNQIIYDNPSPGNKDGGITTLEEKSLGCIQKGGTSMVSNVSFDHQLHNSAGLNVVKSPGNDLVSCTELAAAGASLILFSTGRGTPFGSVVPTLKISTNSKLFALKPNWIDFNAGSLIEGQTMDVALSEFIELIIKVINGQKTMNEVNEIAQIAIFKDGVTL